MIVVVKFVGSIFFNEIFLVVFLSGHMGVVVLMLFSIGLLVYDFLFFCSLI